MQKTIMKTLFTAAILIILHFNLNAQIYDPVKWKFSAVKETNLTYKIIFKATIQPGWHLYSQLQPKNAVAEPLHVSFKKNTQLTFEGKPLETGKLEKTYDKLIKIGAWQYSNQLILTQRVKLTKPLKNKVQGTLTYQTCNNVRCLPAEDVEFSVQL